MTFTSRERPSDPPATWTPNWTPPAQPSASEKQRAPVLTGLSRVGETGFEPATARPPAGCATRLRHSPCVSYRAGDGNRTRPTSLEGSGAATTLRPQSSERFYPFGRRSSVGTMPASSTSAAGGHGPYQLSRAPSSVTTDPLSRRPSGEASRAISQACSSGRPSRPRGTDRAAPCRTTSGYFWIASVSKWPAAAALTATPSAAQVSASSRVRPSTAARAALECVMPARPWCGDSVTLMIVPPPPGLNARSYAASDMVSVPPTFSRVTACQPFNAIASAGTKYWPPALLTSTSSRPKRDSAVSTIASQDERSRTSPATHSQPEPSEPQASASTSSRRPVSNTDAPHASSSRAAAFPSPVPPPVTRTTEPDSRSGAKISEEEPIAPGP